MRTEWLSSRKPIHLGWSQCQGSPGTSSGTRDHQEWPQEPSVIQGGHSARNPQECGARVSFSQVPQRHQLELWFCCYSKIKLFEGSGHLQVCHGTPGAEENLVLLGGADVEGPLSPFLWCQGTLGLGSAWSGWDFSFTLLLLQTQTKLKELQHLGEVEFYLGQAFSHQHQFDMNWRIPCPTLNLQAVSAVTEWEARSR